MIRIACVVLAIVFLGRVSYGAEPELMPKQALSTGWVALFDGQTLFGWKPTGEAEWKVSNGEIRTSGEKSGFLLSTTEFANYHLLVEFKSPAGTNSGVFLRTPVSPTDPTKDCYELNIAPQDNPYPTGSLVGRKKADRVVGGSHTPEELEKGIPIKAWDGQWHVLNVMAEGGKFLVYFDNHLILEFDDPTPIPIGHISLQSREGPIAFRKVWLRPLGLKPIFNGRDLTEWNTDRAERSQFEVTERGELRVLNGPGQIESKGEYEDFVLQLECKIEGDGLNSGIFFRTLREGRWTGYESQINNVYKDGDPTQPADFGTGGIYRRQPARRIVAGDREWFAKTIVADGPHMAVWVNGYQVSDWTDERPANESPREGRRDGPGAIAIQGHDPTTDFLFRNLRIVELPRE